jgi:ElaB/YqjD/DUF883 family membrane-anchored ribosome-binding protein
MEAAVLEKDASLPNAVREVSKVRNIVSEAVDEGIHSASQVLRHGRRAAEDAVEELKHTVKQRPFEAVGLAFAAGILAGGFLTWIGRRRR